VTFIARLSGRLNHASAEAEGPVCVGGVSVPLHLLYADDLSIACLSGAGFKAISAAMGAWDEVAGMLTKADKSAVMGTAFSWREVSGLSFAWCASFAWWSA
jgi:hypothetical protein